MPTTREQLQAYLDAPEDREREFKEAKQNFHFDRLVEYCVALANEGGGQIIFGVTDRRPRRIVGTAAFAEPGRTEAGLHQKLGHRIPVEEMITEAGRVLIVHVPPRLPGTAWQIDGRYLKRAGDELVPLPADELKAIFEEAGPDFSAQPCPASIADLDLYAIDHFRRRWADKTRDERKRTWTDTETLIAAELLVDGRLNYAALILFGTRAALGKYLAQAECVFEYRPNEASGPAGDRVDYREGFFLWQDAIWNRINLRNDRQSYQDGLFRIELPTFDEVSIREGLLNAVAHRDYRQGGSIFVRQYPQRLELVSPGGLPPGITPENILERQNPRNRRLSEAFEKAGLIERSGQGMDLMFESAVRQGKLPPNLAGTSATEVRLTLEGAVRNPGFVRFLAQLGEKTVLNFSTGDFLVLDCIQRELPIPDRYRDRLPGLIEVGAVESVGRGRGVKYILSRRLYGVLGSPGTHTRKKGLDHETQKALLERHLTIQGEAGAALAELCQVLPAASRAGIKRLLQELRTEGRTELRGSRRAARWYKASLAQNSES